MDQQIFDQLDTLERGARIETRLTRESYYINSSAEHPAHGDHEMDYGDDAYYHQGLRHEHDEILDQPMALDSFGKLF